MQPLSRSRYGSRWELCSTCAAACAGALGGGQCFLLWQNHSSTVPKMNTIPAGMPMMTGQGRELEVGENMAVMGGFESAKEDAKKLEGSEQVTSKKLFHLLRIHVQIIFRFITQAIKRYFKTRNHMTEV